MSEKKPKKSWRTTAAGVGQFLAILGAAVAAHFDGDPATVPTWGAVAASAVVMLGLLQARDHGVTSEDAGAKPGVSGGIS